MMTLLEGFPHAKASLACITRTPFSTSPTTGGNLLGYPIWNTVCTSGFSNKSGSGQLGPRELYVSSPIDRLHVKLVKTLLEYIIHYIN